MATQATYSRTPSAFNHPAAAALKFKPREKFPVRRLPYVGFAKRRSGLCYWNVPPSGGYFGGQETGEALARIYLKHVNDQGRDYGGHLQHVVLDMFGCDRDGTPERDALRGQVVGFFCELEKFLAAAMKAVDVGVSDEDAQALLKRANDFLHFDEAAYMASLHKLDEQG
ncbi:hypothetical protein HCH_02884 [Hahella chejuensis KCTC 2396]|uniref:Uncharacterized protein n=1 Tax=Hahella chejuensis (strain KCTC 2396) TaxID=349521 RepID=Q2SI65_HAHCH|nr:hypothetical protein [Hahella chejuensis]ABC29659.1 hypothetical protein HCH_02884 [Hahella chejuensis KCTC 2396]